MAAFPAGARHLLLYDGVCGLCNRVVAYTLKRDERGLFCFAPLQSAAAREALARHGRNPGALDTFYVVAELGAPSERIFAKSRAALFLLRECGGLARALTIFGFLPTALLDALYDLVARHRYRLFGRTDACPLPEPQHRARFLET